MSREQKIRKAAELRAAGWTLKQIASRLETSITTARRWADPESYEKDKLKSREWKARNKDHLHEYDKAYGEFARGECERCGGPTHRQSRTEVCAACISDERHHRGLEIEKLWADGQTLREIAEHLGWTKGHLAMEFDRLRADGYDLPYRYRVGRRNSTKFPEQAAA